MSDLIRVDFEKRRRVVAEPAAHFPTTVELRETAGFERSELLERLAVIEARMAIAAAEPSDLEKQDLAISMEQHILAISPELTPEEIALINRQANQLIDQIS